jgi:hypothetical protein
METLLQSLVPNRTPPGGVVRSVGILPTTAPQAVAPVGIAPPAAPAAPQLSPMAKYIADMQTLISGGIGPLSTGEKISALGQVLQAAGSRGASDPAAVLQNVRQQQMQKLNAQFQIAQMQQAQQEAARQRASVAKYTELLTDNERAALEGLPLDKRAEKISEIAFREKQVREIRRDADGKTRYIYTNGTDQVANWSLPANTKYQNLGDRLVLVDEDTGKPVLDNNGKERTLKVNMSPAEAANYGLAVKREARIAAGGGEGGGAPSYRILNTDTGYWAVDPKNPTRSFGIGLKAPKAASGITIQGDAAQLIADRLRKQR